jgi:hypothetical protein
MNSKGEKRLHLEDFLLIELLANPYFFRTRGPPGEPRSHFINETRGESTKSENKQQGTLLKFSLKTKRNETRVSVTTSQS